MDIRALLEKELGSITDEELKFAKEQYEINFKGQKHYPDTKLDILATNIDFYRRRGLGSDSCISSDSRICRSSN